MYPVGNPAYNRAQYVRERAALLASHPPCAYCGAPATTADHVPPLASFPDPLLWEGYLLPACLPCNTSRGAAWSVSRRRGKVPPPPSRAWDGVRWGLPAPSRAW